MSPWKQENTRKRTLLSSEAYLNLVGVAILHFSFGQKNLIKQIRKDYFFYERFFSKVIKRLMIVFNQPPAKQNLGRCSLGNLRLYGSPFKLPS